MKHRRITTKEIYGCKTCNRNVDGNLQTIQLDFIGCPRGGCDAMIIGKVKTKIILNKDLEQSK